jgi:cellulose synthase/poly-beta-1,6-N-acetylglucosamine synthase-like glycosyltransferase
MNERAVTPHRSVTVIMPIRDEAAYIRVSLEAVLTQDYPRDLIEVIIADGMSTDGTQQIIQEIAAEHARVRIIENLSLTVPAALNSAIALAKGDIIIRVDGHCRVAPDYVRRCVEHLEHDGVDAVGGPIRTIGETPVAQVIAAATSSPFGVGDSTFRTTRSSTVLSDTVPFPAYTRAIIEKAGPYDEELVRNQDDEYNYRLRKLGGKILLASDVISEYYSRSSLGSLWRQYFEYGYWKVRVLQKHPRQMRWRQFVPPLFVGTLALLVVLMPVAAVFSWFLSAVAGMYVFASVLVSTAIARRAQWRFLPLLPVAFGVIHSAFGTGFLVGLIRFFNRWQNTTS